MTESEIKEWERDHVQLLLRGQPALIDHDVVFANKHGSLCFQYLNARGYIFPATIELKPGQYCNQMKLSCRYSDEAQYNPSFEPTLLAASEAIKTSWELFTGDPSRLLLDVYAMSKTELTQPERLDARKHSLSCRCDLCIKFTAYLTLKETLVAWEKANNRKPRLMKTVPSDAKRGEILEEIRQSEIHEEML